MISLTRLSFHDAQTDCTYSLFAKVCKKYEFDKLNEAFRTPIQNKIAVFLARMNK
jgi:hypothetical protein